MDTPFEASGQEAANGPERIWTLRDIFKAVALSFDYEKLLTGAAGLFLAGFVFAFVYWLGRKTGEVGAIRVFTVLATILASCVWVLFSGILAKMALCQLVEGRKAGAEEIRRFLAERWTTLVGTPMAFGALGLFFLGMMALLELIGSLPGLGPILFAASFPLVFLLAFMAMLTGIVHTLGTFLYPSVIALKGAGALGVLMEMFTLVRRRGFLVLLYEATIGAVGLLMTAIIGAAVWAALYVTHWTALALMEEKFEQSLAGIPEFFRVFLEPIERWLPYLPEPMEVGWHYDVAGVMLGLSILWIVAGAAVYPFVFFNTAGSITYLVLRSDSQGGDESA